MRTSIFRRAFSTANNTLTQGTGFERRTFLLNANGEKLSFWNDHPIKNAEINDPTVYNAIVEAPRYTLAKMELLKTEKYHPIGQDVRKNKFNKSVTELRFYAQFGFFNYGYFPQTWENSLVANKEIGNYAGDDDPLDFVELSDKAFPTGTIVPVRVFGSLCMIDAGEIDWKIVCLNLEEANAKNIKTLDDLEKLHPGRLDAIRKWFRVYKTFDGKKESDFYYDGRVLDLDRTQEIITENRHYWQDLCKISKTRDAKTDYEKQLLEKAIKYHL